MLLGVYPKEVNAETRTHIWTDMLIAVLFTIAQTWKQLKCPADKWINKYGVHTQWNIIQPSGRKF